MVEITVLCVTCLACEASCSPTWLFRVNWMVSITFLYGNRPCPFTDATPKWMLITIIPLKEILRNSMLYPRLLGPSYLSILNSISKFFPNFFKRISFPNFQNYPSIVKILLKELLFLINLQKEKTIPLDSLLGWKDFFYYFIDHLVRIILYRKKGRKKGETRIFRRKSMSRQAGTLENNYIPITKIISHLSWMERRNSLDFLPRKDDGEGDDDTIRGINLFFYLMKTNLRKKKLRIDARKS